MKKRLIGSAMLVAVGCCALLQTGCAVVRDQSTVGGYVDDSAITALVKAKMLEDPSVSGLALSVETLNGVVQLSGYAKDDAERSQAERIARSVQGVRAVQNRIAVSR